MKKVTAANYRKHKLYPTIARTVSEILKTSNVVTPLELLLRLQRITKQQCEDWRFGRIPYLERVCVGNLSKLNAILRILDHHSRAIGLKPSQTVYHKWGRGGKRIILRFSKFGEPPLEAAYSRHYVTTRQPLGGDNNPVSAAEDGAASAGLAADAEDAAAVGSAPAQAASRSDPPTRSHTEKDAIPGHTPTPDNDLTARDIATMSKPKRRIDRVLDGSTGFSNNESIDVSGDEAIEFSDDDSIPF